MAQPKSSQCRFWAMLLMLAVTMGAICNSAAAQVLPELPDLKVDGIPEVIPDARLVPIPFQPDLPFKPVHVIGSIAPDLNEVNPTFAGLDRQGWRDLTRHRSAEIRLEALETLEQFSFRMEPDADSDTFAEITDFLGDPDPRVRRRAFDLAVQLGAPEEAFVSKAMEFLDDADPEFRIRAITAIGAYPQHGTNTIERLIELIGDTEMMGNPGLLYSPPTVHYAHMAPMRRMTDFGAVRESAIWALGQIGPEAAAAKPRLLACLQEPNEWIQQIATESLVQIAGSDPDVVALMVARVKEGDELALRQIYEIGEPAASALPYLLSLPADQLFRLNPTSSVHFANVTPLATMARIAPKDERVLDLVKSFAPSSDRHRRTCALEACGLLSPEIAAEYWIEVLKENRRSDENGALLKSLEKHGTSLLPRYLDAALENDDLGTRNNIVSWTRKFGDEAKVGLPGLGMLLDQALANHETLDGEPYTIMLAIWDLDPEVIIENRFPRVRKVGLRMMVDSSLGERIPKERLEAAILKELESADESLRQYAASLLIQKMPERMALALPIVVSTRNSIATQYAENAKAREGLDPDSYASERFFREAETLWRRGAAVKWDLTAMLPTLARFEPKLVDVVLSDLKATTNDNRYPAYAMQALAAAGDVAIEPTLELLNSSDISERLLAVEIIGQFGKPIPQAIAPLLDLLDSQSRPGNEYFNQQRARLAGESLAGMGRLGEQTVEALLAKLHRDENEYVVPALQNQGAALIPLIQPLLQDPRVSPEALQLLMKTAGGLTPPATQLIQDLQIIGEAQPELAHDAAEAILMIDPQNTAALRLRDVSGESYWQLRKRHSDVRQFTDNLRSPPVLEWDEFSPSDIPAVLQALGEFLDTALDEQKPDHIRDDAKIAVRRLLDELLEHPSFLVEPHIDDDVLETLGRVSGLEASVYDNERNFFAARLAALTGERARPMLPALIDDLATERIAGRLARIGINIDPSAAAERLVAKIENREDALIAAVELRDLRFWAPERAVSVLVDYALEESRDNNNGAFPALYSLHSWGAELTEYQDQLVQLMDSENVGGHAARALGNIGQPAVPALAEALFNSNPNVRKHAAQLFRRRLSPYFAEAQRIVAAQTDRPQAEIDRALQLLSGEEE